MGTRRSAGQLMPTSQTALATKVFFLEETRASCGPGLSIGLVAFPRFILYSQGIQGVKGKPRASPAL